MLQEIKMKNLGTVNRNQVVIYANNKSYYFYFSYQTLVGVEKSWGEKFVRQNDWSHTTGKFLNSLEPDKKKRLPEQEFNKQVGKIIDEINAIELSF